MRWGVHVALQAEGPPECTVRQIGPQPDGRDGAIAPRPLMRGSSDPHGDDTAMAVVLGAEFTMEEATEAPKGPTSALRRFFGGFFH